MSNDPGHSPALGNYHLQSNKLFPSNWQYIYTKFMNNEDPEFNETYLFAEYGSWAKGILETEGEASLIRRAFQ